jgi:hypothetical protein
MSYSKLLLRKREVESKRKRRTSEDTGKIGLEIITISEIEASDKINMDKRKLNILKSRKDKYNSLEIIVVFRL